MKKRILIILAIVLAIALLCICTLPLKAGIDLSLSGGRIDFDGNVISEETAAITGCFRNYLLRRDTLELNVDFPGLEKTWKNRHFTQSSRTFLHIVTKERNNRLQFLFQLQNPDFTNRQKSVIIYATKFVIL